MLRSTTTPSRSRHAFVCAALAVVSFTLATTATAEPLPVMPVERATPILFEADILPILRRNCLACHGATQPRGGLVLETVEAMKKGGDSGPALVPGSSATSLVFTLAAHREEPVMPPARNDVNAANLAPEELGLLAAWVDAGALSAGPSAAPVPGAWRPIADGFAPASAVAVTQDARLLAVARGDRLLLHDAATGRRVAALVDPSLGERAHGDLVEALAFNREGDLLASGGFREAKIWRRPRDVRAFELAGAGPVTALATSPDGRFVATSAAGAIRLWDAATGAAGGVFPGPVDGATALVFSADGASLMAAAGDGTVRRVRTSDGTLEGILDAAQPIRSLALVPTGGNHPSAGGAAAILALGGTDSVLRTFHIPLVVPQRLVADPEPRRRLDTSRDGRLIATSGQSGRVMLVEVGEDGGTRPLAEWALHKGPATSLCVVEGPAGAAIATGASDGSISLWSATDGGLLRRCWGGGAPVVSLTATVDGRLVSGDDRGTVSIWRPPAPRAPSAVPPEESLDAVTATAFHAGRRMLATAGSAAGRALIVVRPLDGQAPPMTLSGHTGPVRAIAFAADGSRLLSGGDDRSLRLWDLSRPAEPSATLGDTAATVTALALSTDLTRAITAGGDHVVRAWSLADGKLLREYRGHTAALLAVGWDPGGQPWSASADATVRTWNPADGAQVSSWTLPVAPLALVPSADGASLVVVGNDGVVRSHDRRGGQLQKTFVGPAGAPTTLMISADGTRAATLEGSGAHATARLWDVTEGRLLEGIEVPASSAVIPVSSSEFHRIGPRGEVTALATALENRVEGPAQPIAIAGLTVSADGVLVVATADGGLRGFRLADLQPTFTTSHGAGITSIAAARDGGTVATGGKGGGVRLWKSDGSPLGPGISGLAGDVTAVTLPSDGRRVAAAIAAAPPAGTTVTVHDAATGALLERFAGHTTLVTDLRSDTSGSVVSAADDAIWRWSPAGLDVIAGHGGPVTAIAAVPTAPLEVVTGCTDGIVRRIRLGDGHVLGQFSHGGPVTGVAVRPDGGRVASVGEGKSLRLWRPDGQPVAEVRGDLRRAATVTLLTREHTSAGERVTLAKQRAEAAEKDAPAKAEAAAKAKAALDAAEADMKAKQDAFVAADAARITAETTALAASAEARTAIAARERADKQVRDVQGELQTAKQRAALLAASAAAAPGDGARKQAADAATAAVATTEQRLQQMQSAAQTAATAATTFATNANAMTQKVLDVQKPAGDAAMTLRAAQAARRLAAQQHDLAARESTDAAAALPGAREFLARAESALTATKQALEQATAAAAAAVAPIRHVAFSPDGTTVATAGDHPDLHLWDAETGSALSSFAGHASPLVASAFLPGGRLVTAGRDAAAIAWEVSPPWRLERTIDGADGTGGIADRALALDWSPDAAILLVGGGVPSRFGELALFEVATGKRVLHLPDAHDDAILAARFAPDGQRVATASADKYLRTFDTADGRMLRRFEGHTNYVLGVAWKADGQTIASAGADGTVKVWDAVTADQRLSIGPFTRHVTAVRFMGDGDTLVAAGGDRIVRMLNASSGGTIRTFPEAPAWIHAVDVSPGGDVLAAGAADGTVRTWNATTGQALPPPEAAER